MRKIEVDISTLAKLHGLVDACKINLGQAEAALREMERALVVLKYDGKCEKCVNPLLKMSHTCGK